MKSKSLTFVISALVVLAFSALLANARTYSIMEMSWEQRNEFLKVSDAWIVANTTRQVIPEDLPTEFDGRKVWPDCIHPVLDQGQCSSCWAFAASEVLSDRFCIASKGSVNVVLSPENLLSCEFENGWCKMGSASNFAWDYLLNPGIVSLSCVPYTSGDGTDPPCQTQCADGEQFIKYKAASYEHVGSFIEPSSHVAEIMTALMDGPVDATFEVYEDFFDYPGGVYNYQSGSFSGLHAIKLIGWGTYSTGQDYWIAQNSWGPDWGPYGGYFLIAKGVDECLIEASIYTGAPLLS
jgi:cathepsin B